jgi:hypothetical protein
MRLGSVYHVPGQGQTTKESKVDAAFPYLVQQVGVPLKADF